MNERYADKRNVVASLREHINSSDEDEGRITVYDTDTRIVADDRDEMEERNLWNASIERIDDIICSIDWEVTSFGTQLLELNFHESELDNEFTLAPAGVNAIAPQQATSPTDLGPRLDEALTTLEEELDAAFTFQEVSAGSMANGGHYTDFEFKYSIDTMESL